VESADPAVDTSNTKTDFLFELERGVKHAADYFFLPKRNLGSLARTATLCFTAGTTAGDCPHDQRGAVPRINASWKPPVHITENSIPAGGLKDIASRFRGG
jgi:hypothetical protein